MATGGGCLPRSCDAPSTFSACTAQSECIPRSSPTSDPGATSSKPINCRTSLSNARPRSRSYIRSRLLFEGLQTLNLNDAQFYKLGNREDTQNSQRAPRGLYGWKEFDGLLTHTFSGNRGPQTFASWRSRLRPSGVLFPGQFTQQPRFGHFPVALGGLGGNSQGLGGFLHAQTTEVAQLHDPAFAGINLRQRC